MNNSLTFLLKILLPLFALSCLIYSFIVISNSIGASDEELTDFTNAVAMNNNESISPSIHIFGKEIPYVNSPYMGSMKSWVVAPLLKNFGASIHLIRFSNVIFAIIYLYCFYWALRVMVGDEFALLVFLIPVWDTKFLLYTPTDYGPFLFQLIFIVLSIGGIARFYKNENTKWWFFANLMIGAVLYQKFTSLPIFLTLLLTNNLIYLKLNIDSLFSIRVARDILLSIACILLPLTPYLYYFYNVGTSDFFSITSDPEKINLFTYFPKLEHVFTYFLNSFDGVHYARGLILVKEINPVLAIFGYFSLVTIIISSILYFTKKLKNVNFGLILSIFVIGLLIFVSIRGLVRDHHYLVLNPLWLSLFIISFYMLSQYVNEKYNNRWIPAAIFIFIPSLFMFNNSRVLLNNILEYKGAALSSTPGVRLVVASKI